jgi:hypothetical protein
MEVLAQHGSRSFAMETQNGLPKAEPEELSQGSEGGGQNLDAAPEFFSGGVHEPFREGGCPYG